MDRVKIAMYFRDKEYQNRFVKCWMHHFDTRYEVHIFDSVEEVLKRKEAMFFILEGVSQEEVDKVAQEDVLALCLLEDKVISSDTYENILLTPKYQQVYKIEQILKEWIQRAGVEVLGTARWQTVRKQIGVFSLDLENLQIPFCAMAASEYGEKAETILVDLQIASGLGHMKDDNETLTMEELLVAAKTMSYSKDRIRDGIMQEQNWDYVIPAKTAIHLAETDASTYNNLLQILIKEMGYEVTVLNFGVIFSGILELMQACDVIYLLVSQKDRISRREEAFRKELERLGEEKLLQKLVQIEIPSTFSHYESWRKLAQKWRWDSVGDQLRRGMVNG